jgi:hypothetical protein
MFVPGISGNPNGRVKTPQELKDAFRALSMDAKDVLAEVMKNPKSKGSDRVKAAEIILNRAWGTPEQSVTMNGAIATMPIDTSKLSDKQQDVLLEALSLCLTPPDNESQAPD